MKQIFTLFLGCILSVAAVAQSNECPEAGITRYEASSFVYYANSFSLIAFKFNGPDCGHGIWHFNEGAYLDVNADGSALLHGEGVYSDECGAHDGEVWNVNVAFLATDPFEPYNPKGNPDTSIWEYFVMDDANSYLESTVTNERVTLRQRGPGSQLGQGANDKTDTFGFSTWFYYVREGGNPGGTTGDVNIDLRLIECEEEKVCTNEFRTQTPGGWGACPRGNNPASYLYANFASAFPEGLVVGCDKTLTFTSPQAITYFLPSGGSPAALYSSYTNPYWRMGTLASHTVALALTVGFDNNDVNFGSSESTLATMYVASGTFAGWTVAEVLAEANNVLGGCNSAYSASQVKSAVAAINENYVDGKVTGNYLTCSPGQETPEEEEPSCPVVSVEVSAYPNPMVNCLNIKLEGNQAEKMYFAVYDSRGYKRGYGSASIKKGGDLVKLNVSSLPKGTYYLGVLVDGKLEVITVTK